MWRIHCVLLWSRAALVESSRETLRQPERKEAVKRRRRVRCAPRDRSVPRVSRGGALVRAGPKGGSKTGKARANRSEWRATPRLARLPALILALVITAGIVTQPASGQTSELPAAAPSLQPLLDFKDPDIKFHLRSLMNILRDRDHEGWVLAAYPDPSTGKPLIGAGFSLEVAATDHPQSDSHNPNLFLEPSSAQLWQAAGLDPDRLQAILDRFNRDLDVWTKKGYSRRVKANALRPELTVEEATSLLPDLHDPGDPQCVGLLPRIRSADRIAADGPEPTGISNGGKPRGVCRLSRRH